MRRERGRGGAAPVWSKTCQRGPASVQARAPVRGAWDEWGRVGVGAASMVVVQANRSGAIGAGKLKQNGSAGSWAGASLPSPRLVRAAVGDEGAAPRRQRPPVGPAHKPLQEGSARRKLVQPLAHHVHLGAPLRQRGQTEGKAWSREALRHGAAWPAGPCTGRARPAHQRAQQAGQEVVQGGLPAGQPRAQPLHVHPRRALVARALQPHQQHQLDGVVKGDPTAGQTGGVGGPGNGLGRGRCAMRLRAPCRRGSCERRSGRRLTTAARRPAAAPQP